MSECSKYQHRQPVQVKWRGEWCDAVYLGYFEEYEGHKFEKPHLCSLFGGVPQSNWDHLLAPDEIRPDPDYRLAPVAEPARMGWRLPEPGDVVMRPRDMHAGEFVVYAVHWDNPRPLLCKGSIGGSQRFNLWEVELVRLHDAPKPFFEPGEDITASKINEALRLRPRPAKQGIIDNATLELAAVALEQHGQDRIAAMVRDLQRDWSEAS